MRKLEFKQLISLWLIWIIIYGIMSIIIGIIIEDMENVLLISGIVIVLTITASITTFLTGKKVE